MLKYNDSYMTVLTSLNNLVQVLSKLDEIKKVMLV